MGHVGDGGTLLVEDHNNILNSAFSLHVLLNILNTQDGHANEIGVIWLRVHLVQHEALSHKNWSVLSVSTGDVHESLIKQVEHYRVYFERKLLVLEIQFCLNCIVSTLNVHFLRVQKS